MTHCEHTPDTTAQPRIGVVILNYNGWQDTLACAESVLNGAVLPAWLVVVDNASPNDSVRWLRHWAAGRMDFALPELGVPNPCPKPLPLLELEDAVRHASPAPLVLLRCSNNAGYAAGNNAGIRLLMAWGADAVWILNNDTVVDKNALANMARRLFAKERTGLCGSLVCYQDCGLVQCRAGGRTNKWTGLSVLDGNKEDVAQATHTNAAQVEGRLNFIYGASVMASRRFIKEVGLMDERYFLYCEEQDWAYSAKGRFDFAYAQDALVWHKEGGSTGFSHASFNAHRLLQLTRSRLLLTAKHHPLALPSVCLSIVFAAARMAWRRLGRRLWRASR